MKRHWSYLKYVLRHKWFVWQASPKIGASLWKVRRDVGQPCEDCNGTGWYGDNGPGIVGNSEFVRCDCGTGAKCGIGCHPYVVIGGVAWCRICNREADLEICRINHVLPNKKVRV
jgi:hypothetical protein